MGIARRSTGSAQEMSGSGGEVVGIPLLVEQQDAYGGHGVGAVRAPTHARSLLAGSDHLLAGALDHPAADVPAGGPILVVGHAGGLVGEVRHLLVAHGRRLAPTGPR